MDCLPYLILYLNQNNKMIRIFILPLFLLYSFLAVGQQENIATGTQPLSTVPIVNLPTQDNKALLKAELALRGPARPNHFAKTIEVDLSTDENGLWETLVDGTEVWRLQIKSTNAKSLNLGITEFFMPANGSLVIYAPDQKALIGPYGPEHNKSHDQLWTPIIYTDHIVLEVHLKSANRDELSMNISYVNHDFVGFGLAESGSCNLDVLCGATDGFAMVDNYRDIIQSVGVYTLNGNLNCTGFLVNNTNNDFTPYFMTADHCGVTNNSDASVVVYWNFQQSYCRQPGSAESGGNGDGLLNDITASMGSTLRASGGNSDFSLTELDDPIHPDANAYFAGWSNEDVAPPTAICVHHPGTEEKRISFEDDATNIGDQGGNPNSGGQYIVVNDWDTGTTEGGSSGSPLFNAEGLVVGQLYGGAASCSNDDYDVYGRFFNSWNAGGSAASSLQFWLDPNNSGVTSIDGLDSNYSLALEAGNQNACTNQNVVYQLTVAELFANDVMLTASNVPNGLSLNYSVNPVPPAGMCTITVTGTGNLSAGQYTIELEGTDGTNSANTSLVLNLYEATILAPSLQIPGNGNTNVSTLTMFEWAVDPNSQNYTIEVATDMSFNNIVATDSAITDNIFNATLNSTTTYYWRVLSNNICGTSSWSNVYSFTTANITCFANESQELILIDSGDPDQYFSTMEVNQGGNIIDLNVINIMGTHSYVGDLTFVLISPAGTAVELVAEQCDDLADFNIGFDDSATNGPPCPYTDGLTYSPSENLSTFNGEDAQGTWTLLIEDNAFADGGSLEFWSLQFCTGPDIGLAIINSELEICAGESVAYEINIGSGFGGPIDLELFGQPTNSIYSFFPNPGIPGSVSVLTIENINEAGDYNLEITGFDGDAAVSSFAGLLVDEIANATNLENPSNNEVMVDPNVLFNWSDVNGAIDYEITIATDPNLQDIVEIEYLNSSQYISNLLANQTTYYWQVATIGACGGESSMTYTFTTGESAIENLNEIEIEIFPNPNNGFFNVRFNEPINSSVIAEVYNINGQLIYQQENNVNQEVYIALNNQVAGIYFLKLIHKEFSLTKKVSINK